MNTRQSTFRIYERPDRPGWWFRYTDPTTGKRRQVKAGVGRDEAEQTARLHQMMFVSSPGRMAEVSAHTRNMQFFTEAYRDYLVGRRSSARHIKETLNTIARILDGSGVTTLGSLTNESVSVSLDRISSSRSARTYNAYLASVRGFTRWCVFRGYLVSDPLVGFKRLNEAVDCRQPSRALETEEMNALFGACPCFMRRAYYLVAVRTGLRWGEISKLNWSNIDLDAGIIHLVAANTKSRKADHIPIAPELGDMLRAVRRKAEDSQGDCLSDTLGCAPGDRVFDTTPTARTWISDLGRAGIEYRTSDGQADRKSLRKTFVTHLIKAGVHPRTVQQLARHSDIRLTMGVYTDERMLDLREAVSALYPLPTGE